MRHRQVRRCRCRRMCNGTRSASLSKAINIILLHVSPANMSQSMECSLWYASPYRVLLVFSAAKSPTFRHELRHASSGYEFAKLPAAERLTTTKRYPRNARPAPSILELRRCHSVVCHTNHVARGGSQFIPRWAQAKMGPRQLFHGRPIYVQTRTMIYSEKAKQSS